MMDRNRALVLAGGGVLGISWEIGLTAGLAHESVFLAEADLIVGTSGGATVAVQIASAPIEQLYRDQIEGSGPSEPTIDGVDVADLIARIADTIGRTPEPLQARKTIGAWSLERDRVPEAERRKLVEARLPRHRWPDQRIALTAINAKTGELRIFDKDSRVHVVDAVAASCALPVVWPAVTIDGQRYYDGGIRSITNTDVADGYRQVLVVKVFDMPESSDVKDISGASNLYTIVADEASTSLIGADPMDPGRRAAVARAGYDQGVRVANAVRSFWRG